MRGEQLILLQAMPGPYPELLLLQLLFIGGCPFMGPPESDLDKSFGYNKIHSWVYVLLNPKGTYFKASMDRGWLQVKLF